MARFERTWKVGLALVVFTGLGLYWGQPALFSAPVPALEAVGLHLWKADNQATARQASGAQREGRKGGGQDILVRARNVTTGVTDTFVRAIGTGRAVRKTDLYPESAGRITALPFGPGAWVKQGDVVLMLDDAEEKLAVDRAKLTLKDAQDQVERFEKLMTSRTISVVQMQDARTATREAELDLEKARIELNRRLVRAPFDGIMGILDVEIGDYVTQTSRITGLDDRSSILVEFVVPERFANKVALEDVVELRTEAKPGQVFEGKLTAVENRVDSESRTLKVQATVPNPQDFLRTGSAFDTRILLKGDEWPAIPSIALKWDRAGPHVWLIRDGKAQRVGVTIIERSADRVLINGEVEAGDVVVTETVRNLRPGAPVTIQPEPGYSLQMPESDQQPLASSRGARDGAKSKKVEQRKQDG